MIGLIQRVSSSSVVVEGETIAQIDRGLTVLLGIERKDDEKSADKLLNKILAYRIFEDDKGYMNLGLRQIGGDLLLVPQFTLAADTNSGLRPGFSTAAAPESAEELFHYTVSRARSAHGVVESGRFGAHMQVQLINDGPATFWLQAR